MYRRLETVGHGMTGHYKDMTWQDGPHYPTPVPGRYNNICINRPVASPPFQNQVYLFLAISSKVHVSLWSTILKDLNIPSVENNDETDELKYAIKMITYPTNSSYNTAKPGPIIGTFKGRRDLAVSFHPQLSQILKFEFLIRTYLHFMFTRSFRSKHPLIMLFT